MADPNFRDTTLLLTEVNATGAIALVLNQPLGKNLNALVEFKYSKPFPLYTGGPVDREHLYFIHRQPLFISGGELVTDNLYFGGNFSEAVAAINADLLTTNDIRIFTGYCGWDTGELEAEIAEGSWEVAGFSIKKYF